jgi:thioredoxin-dependent peroxiredoxin
MWRKWLLVASLGIVSWSILCGDGHAQSLQVGDFVPEFEAQSDDGEVWKLREKLGRRMMVLFFYQSDFSFCCTRQAERYRDAQRELAMLDVDLVGISCDSQESHQLFKLAHALNYPLLSDQDGSIARQLGVPLRAGGKAMAHDTFGKSLTDANGEALHFTRDWTAARWTFVIGKDGRVLHRDTRVSPIGDSKRVAEVICKLTATAN